MKKPPAAVGAGNTRKNQTFGGTMMTASKLIFPVTITLAVIALAVAGHGRSEESAPGVTPLGNGFTYQGNLDFNGGPVNDQCEFKFWLYDSATAGTLLAGPLELVGVAVTDGLFTVILDFSPFAFLETAERYLEIAVSCPSAGAGFTTLSPRQLITPTPFALTSKRANFALQSDFAFQSGTDAAFINGVTSSGIEGEQSVGVVQLFVSGPGTIVVNVSGDCNVLARRNTYDWFNGCVFFGSSEQAYGTFSFSLQADDGGGILQSQPLDVRFPGGLDGMSFAINHAFPVDTVGTVAIRHRVSYALPEDQPCIQANVFGSVYEFISNDVAVGSLNAIFVPGP